ncbi:hypothetical protein KSP40_PGU022026 [Platanthera guangdongensis]|uniref:Uncharacterized protein n=1 Tax=Platanthera guangdongensis TaxID=2320717 RepID=A0ABR2MLG4_9ASPA
MTAGQPMTQARQPTRCKKNCISGRAATAATDAAVEVFFTMGRPAAAGSLAAPIPFFLQRGGTYVRRTKEEDTAEQPSSVCRCPFGRETDHVGEQEEKSANQETVALRSREELLPDHWSRAEAATCPLQAAAHPSMFSTPTIHLPPSSRLPSGAPVASTQSSLRPLQIPLPTLSLQAAACNPSGATFLCPFPFESVYMDGEIRVAKDIRGDYLVVDRAPYLETMNRRPHISGVLHLNNYFEFRV